MNPDGCAFGVPWEDLNSNAVKAHPLNGVRDQILSFSMKPPVPWYRCGLYSKYRLRKLYPKTTLSLDGDLPHLGDDFTPLLMCSRALREPSVNDSDNP